MNKIKLEMKGYSVNIGIDTLKPSVYGRAVAKLTGSKDAVRLLDLSKKNEFLSNYTLINRKASLRGFNRTLKNISRKIEDSDTLMISFSGHGSIISDSSGNSYQAICLYDYPLREDEFWSILSKHLPPKLKILLILDCCYSGGIESKSSIFFIRNKVFTEKRINTPFMQQIVDNNINRLKTNWVKIEKDANKKFIIKKFAASQANEEAWHTKEGGVFSLTLDELWNEGTFNSSFESFAAELIKRVNNINTPLSQKPLYKNEGMMSVCWNNAPPFELI